MASTIPNTFTNGTTADADEVNANFAYVGNVVQLGSGTFTSTEVAEVVEEAGSFSIDADLGSGMIVVDITATRTSGAGATNDIVLDNTTATVTGSFSLFNFGADAYLGLRMQRSQATAGRVSATRVRDDTAARVLDDAEFVVNAAETFYVNVESAANTIIKVVWTAYLVK